MDGSRATANGLGERTRYALDQFDDAPRRFDEGNATRGHGEADGYADVLGEDPGHTGGAQEDEGLGLRGGGRRRLPWRQPFASGPVLLHRSPPSRRPVRRSDETSPNSRLH